MKVTQSPAPARVFGNAALLLSILSFPATSRTALAADAGSSPSTQPASPEQNAWLTAPICHPTAEQFHNAVNGATSNEQIASRLIVASADELNLPAALKQQILVNPFTFSKTIKVVSPGNYDLPLTTTQLANSVGKVLHDELRDRRSIVFPQPPLIADPIKPTLFVPFRQAPSELVKGNMLEFGPGNALEEIQSARKLYLHHSIITLSRQEFVYNYYFTDILLGRGQINITPQSHSDLLKSPSGDGWARTLTERTSTFEDLTPAERDAFAVLLNMNAQGTLGVNLHKPKIYCLVDATEDSGARNPGCFSPEQFSTLKAKAEENSFRVDASWVNNSPGALPMIIGGSLAAAAVVGGSLALWHRTSRKKTAVP